MKSDHKRNGVFYTAVVLGGLSLFVFPRVLAAVEIAPASAADILEALGPDARGLSIHQDSLPDLFTLTSSRIDENATRFIIEEPYLGGHWKDGKAVIEFARDLSYTLVSIYDKSGRRQRIYSVRSSYAEHIAKARSSAGRAPERTQEPPVSRYEQPPEQERSQRTASYGRSATQERRTTTSRAVPVTETAAVPSAAAEAYEWDEAKGDYVPAGTAGAPVKEEPEETETARTVEKQSSKSYERYEREEPAPSESASSKSSKRRRYRRGSNTEVAGAATASAKTASGSSSVSQSGDVWLPTESKATSKSTSKPASQGAVVTAAGAQWVERKEVTVTPAEPQRQESTRSTRREETRREETRREEARREETRRKDAKREEKRREETVVAQKYTPPVEISAPVNIDEASVPSTEELITGEAPAKEVVREVVEEVPAEPAKPVKPITAAGDEWVPKTVATPEYKEPVLPKETKQVARLPRGTAVDNEAFMNTPAKEPATQPGDSWAPKKGAVDTQGTEAQLSNEIKRLREEEKRRASVASKPTIRRDVNNPEEGVLPVSSFEKFSGSMFGRHREYERRFYAGKKAKSKAPEHDFYVDEVDRKKEIHNIYFYQHQKGKAPRLVAVQRHEKVSFRGNYDIDKEDAGKLSTYN